MGKRYFLTRRTIINPICRHAYNNDDDDELCVLTLLKEAIRPSLGELGYENHPTFYLSSSEGRAPLGPDRLWERTAKVPATELRVSSSYEGADPLLLSVPLIYNRSY